MDANQRLAQLALARGLASSQELEACMLAVDERRRATGETPQLGRVMVDMGLLTVDEARQLTDAEPTRTRLKCPRCETPFTIVNLPPGRMVPCKQCNVALVPAPREEDAPTGAPATEPLAQRVPAAGAVDTDDPLIGTTLSDKYRIESLIGRGGMGKVFRAVHTALGRPCAVKVLPMELALDERLVERFRQEARATAALDAPNVVTIFDVARDGHVDYLAMELLDGQTAGELLEARGRLPWREAVQIARQAAQGLAAAHAKGIIHRDIKPDNLMLTRTGRVKVMDFGLARLAEGTSHLSRTGEVLGTPHYMSPEQARAEELDARADLYSLGVTLYRLVSGQTPFTAPTPAVLLLKVLTESPERVDALCDDVPAALADVIEQMMAKSLDDRPADAGRCVAMLGALLETDDAAPAPSVPALAPSPPAPPPSRRWIVAAVLGLLGVTVIVALLARGGRTAPVEPSPPAPRATPGPDAAALREKLAAAELAAAEQAAARERAARERTAAEARAAKTAREASPATTAHGSARLADAVRPLVLHRKRPQLEAVLARVLGDHPGLADQARSHMRDLGRIEALYQSLPRVAKANQRRRPAFLIKHPALALQPLAEVTEAGLVVGGSRTTLTWDQLDPTEIDLLNRRTASQAVHLDPLAVATFLAYAGHPDLVDRRLSHDDLGPTVVRWLADTPASEIEALGGLWRGMPVRTAPVATRSWHATLNVDGGDLWADGRWRRVGQVLRGMGALRLATQVQPQASWTFMVVWQPVRRRDGSVGLVLSHPATEPEAGWMLRLQATPTADALDLLVIRGGRRVAAQRWSAPMGTDGATQLLLHRDARGLLTFRCKQLPDGAETKRPITTHLPGERPLDLAVVASDLVDVTSIRVTAPGDALVLGRTWVR